MMTTTPPVVVKVVESPSDVSVVPVISPLVVLAPSDALPAPLPNTRRASLSNVTAALDRLAFLTVSAATVPVRLPALRLVRADPFPLKLPLMVPAENPPLPSRATIVFAELELVAFVPRLNDPPSVTAPPPDSPPPVLIVSPLLISA